MAVHVIDTIKPKNGLNFPVVEAIDVFVEDYENLADAISHFATDAMIAAINAVLSDKANTSDVNTAVLNLQNQINQIEISATAEAVVAPEVAAARVGADGTSYLTLKARLDAEYASNLNNINDINNVLELSPSAHEIDESTTVAIPYRDYSTAISGLPIQSDTEYTISLEIAESIDKGVTAYLCDSEDNTLSSKTLAAGETTYSWTYISDSNYPNAFLKIYCTADTSEELTVSINGGQDSPASSARIDKIESDIESIIDDTTVSDAVDELKNILEYVPQSESYDESVTIPIPYRVYETVFENLLLTEGSEYLITISLSNAISKGVTLYLYDSDDNILTSKTIGAGGTTYSWTYTPPATYTNVVAKAYCTAQTSETLTTELSGGASIPASSARLDRIEKNQSNILNGKKWVVVGDSFTNGSNSYDDIIPEGKYKGKRATYHYLIGNRNNMNIINFAEGGRTLTTPETILVHNCFSDLESSQNYTNIPADADYITIWLGINDSKTETGEASVGETPLGTIDDTTVHTFYGAWNVVLEYLLEHNPYAHIGIIVSNGCTGTNYPNAIKEAARKWGVAYLDLNGDYTVPLMHRVNGKSEVCERAIELRKSAFWVSESNGHPNAHAQAYQSTFIENWLKSL